MGATEKPGAVDQQRVSTDGVELGLIGRFGRFVFRHHRWVGLIWLGVLVGAGALATADHGATSNNFSVPGADSQAAYDLLQDRFTSQNAATAQVVLQAAEGSTLQADAAGVASMVAALERTPGVASVSNPLTADVTEALQQVAGSLPPAEQQAAKDLAKGIPSSISSDGRLAVVTVSFAESMTDLLDRYPPSADLAATAYANPYSQLQSAVTAATPAGITTYVGGPVADSWNQPVSWWASHSDEVGLGIGAVLLLVAFGSFFGMVIPIVTALFGAVTASGLVYLLATQIDVSSAAPAVTLMISIGVGLDYSLLIVTRYRELLADGLEPEAAAGVAISTAGRSALFAGVTVCLALLGLVLVPIPLVQTLGVAAAIGVAVMMIAAVTLLLALLGFAGGKIDRWSIRRSTGDPVDLESSFWGRFATRMSARPWVALVGGTVFLLLLAIPFLRIQFGMPADNSLPAGLSQRNAYELIDEGFGPGTNGPLVVAVGLPNGVPYAQALQQVAPVSKAVAALQPPGTLRGVEYSVGPIPNSATETTAVIYQIIPTTGPNDPATTMLVERLRADLATATKGTALAAHVGGATATLIDLTDLVSRYLPIVIGGVVIGAFILLVLVFRSILVPIKAAVMNLISIAAAYGVVVVVFQWGWGKSIVGISETIPIVSFVPLVMFVILFGLSMDYEVFLMSRIKEEWDRTSDPKASVVRGVAGTARVITTAALIMLAVFLSFVTNANPTVKLIGFGMAVAVLLDSTVVRMVLVPAIMELFGRRAWWFPSWLNWLPKLDVEGRGVVESLDAVEAAGADRAEAAAAESAESAGA
ncbi:MAG: MMPL family transporter [Microthrixaceae bacterium]